MNLENKHWITICTHVYDAEDGDPTVYSIDNYYNDDNNASVIRRWFAKYFGLNTKESNHPNQFNYRDFDCHEIIMENNPST